MQKRKRKQEEIIFHNFRSNKPKLDYSCTHPAEVTLIQSDMTVVENFPTPFAAISKSSLTAADLHLGRLQHTHSVPFAVFK